ncbi:unnamed protein product [Arabis nemorensis]|uniref:Uncharacterized protein n=1 Tax=Arabis nemorensis TaxID=586526 RepID=A0A565B5T3_9BRAS|nr:unnamed protein product [Arabis nemorensis]
MALSDLCQFLFDKLVEPFWGNYKSEKCPELVISGIAAELMGLNLLDHNSKVLCIGQGSDLAISVFKEKGFTDAHRVLGHPLFALMGRKHVYELAFPENSFDFVYYGDIDQRVIIVPALLVLEMERVLKPGGIGAVLVKTNGGLYNSNSLVKSATSVSSLLKLSEIVHVKSMDGFTVVVFKKNVMENASDYAGKNQLPSDCQSVVNAKPYIGFMEPLLETKPVEFPKSVAYLPKFLDVSPKKRLVYVDIGATEYPNDNISSSSSSWFLPSYPIDSKAFNIYIVDHNASVLLMEVKKPGVTFVYHPGLAGDNNATAKNITLSEYLEPFPEEEEESFYFLAWFEETAKYAEFVVLKMNTSGVEMKFLSGLIETEAICYVDELFLRCTNKPDCMDILQSLRSRGVFVHQWWGGD